MRPLDPGLMMNGPFEQRATTCRSCGHRARIAHAYGLSCIAIGIVLLAGCDGRDLAYPTAATPEQLVVHGMLVAGQVAQEVVVEYARAIGDGYFEGLTPASGARVSVLVGDSVIEFAEVADTPGLFRARFTPATGERYALRVEGPEGEVASSETVIPGAPRLTVPSADTVLPPAPVEGWDIEVRWTSAAGAGYLIAMRDPDRDAPTVRFGRLVSAFVVRHDTVAVVNVGNFLEDPDGVRLNIASVDSNYAGYVDPDPVTTVPASPARSTLEGAYGIFGSIAYGNTRTVRIEP